jgi:hypothetical protein
MPKIQAENSGGKLLRKFAAENLGGKLLFRETGACEGIKNRTGANNGKVNEKKQERKNFELKAKEK